MTKNILTTEAAVSLGIKEAGIGKKGSKDLSEDLILQIIQELKTSAVPPIQKSAFFGALFMKGTTSLEKKIELALKPNALSHPETLIETIQPTAPVPIKNFCARILNQETFTKDEAFQLGKFLLSETPEEALRGLIASVLRVRYETADEYEGFLQSITDSFLPIWKTPQNQIDLIQLAEPFDGVDHSYMITPLLAAELQKHFPQKTIIHQVGRNSGPKFIFNLLDLAEGLGGEFLNHPASVAIRRPEFGFFIKQSDLSKQLDLWVERRRLIIKRPLFATLERFVNPLGAKIMIASAFHPPYAEKMLNICEGARYQSGIIIRNGLEGTLAFALLRPVKILCTARQHDGSYRRQEFEFDPEQFSDQKIDVEEKLVAPSLDENLRLIRLYQQHGKTNNALFDLRVKFTTHGISEAIQWVEKNTATE
jgi:anthranilate phosphoribosyltransferase